ncbi:hypothetical protein JCM6882_003393 [Rhodosporidiobolus microsporus]
MFAQSSTASPFRTTAGSNPYGTPQASSPFAQQQHQQQQQQPSYFGASTAAGGQNTFSGPQFGGGNSHGWGGAQQGGSPASGAFGGGSQFGAGGGGGYGSPYGGAAAQGGLQGSSGGAGAAGTPGQQGKRNYLPGYLSGGGAAAQSEATSPQPMADDRAWDSPAGRRTSVSGSPVTRFGGGSLFGATTGTPSKSPKFTPYTAPPRATAYRAEPEEDAPPVASLNEFESHDQGLHAEPAFNPLRRSPSGDPSSASPFSSSIALPHTSSTPSTDGYAVHIFGFPPSALDLVLDYFSQFGEVVSKTPSPEGGNWITLAYAQPWSAARAARKNGEVLGGVLMVGVKALDEDALKRALAGAEGEAIHASSGAGTPVPRPPPTAVSTPSGVGRPVNVLGPQSAFKAQPTPTRKGFLGLGGGVAPGTPTGGASGGGDAQASLFAERSKAAALAQQEGQQPKSALGRVSEAIFGW